MASFMKPLMFLLAMLLGMVAPVASAGPPLSAGSAACPPEDEAACMMEAIWEAAGRLPPDRRTRVLPEFATLISALPDPAMRAAWTARTGGASAPVRGPDYALMTAREVIAAHGWDGFIDRAVHASPPLNTGRPEIMAAARALAPDRKASEDLTSLMFSLAGSPEPARAGRAMFEQADFGHVLAEAMMQECRGDLFAAARRFTSAPDSIRYRLWSARISGGAGRLAGSVRLGDGTNDTAFIRQAIEGYRPVLERGYCDE